MSAEHSALLNLIPLTRAELLPPNLLNYIKAIDENKLYGILKFKLTFSDRTTTEVRSAGQVLEDQIKMDIRDLLISPSSQEQAEAAHSLVYILHGTGNLTDSQREADLQSIYMKWPTQREHLINNEVRTVSRISTLIDRVNKS
jgi:hypothetical protein